jgi:hypothetical protein
MCKYICMLYERKADLPVRNHGRYDLRGDGTNRFG